jgi:hypothetical protein
MTITFPQVRIVSPNEFDFGTAQTPGSERLAAITPELGVQTSMWGGGSRLSQAPVPVFTIMVASRRSPSFFQACAKSVGAHKENSPRLRRQATLSMCPPSCSTWRSICPQRSRFTGWSCGARQHRSLSTFRMRCGARGDRPLAPRQQSADQEGVDPPAGATSGAPFRHREMRCNHGTSCQWVAAALLPRTLVCRGEAPLRIEAPRSRFSVLGINHSIRVQLIRRIGT